MGLVTADAIRNFANIFDALDTIVDEVEKSAEEIVIGHLGYNPISAAYDHSIVGLGESLVHLASFPVSGNITINGTVYTPAQYFADKNIVAVPGVTFPYPDRVSLAYTAGYALASIPATILHTITQIAALLLTERGNIGISGMSDANTGSRTFISYTNFDKYLKNLNAHRLRKPLV